MATRSIKRVLRNLVAFALALSAVICSGSAATAATTSDSDSWPQPLIRIIPGSEVNLVSRDSYLPISIRNDYPIEVRVQVHVEPKSVNAFVATVVEQTIPANTTDTVKVPIKAITDGEVGIKAWITTFSGVPIGEPVALKMNINAEIEQSIIAVFLAVVLGLAVIGTVRTVGKRRRASQLEAQR